MGLHGEKFLVSEPCPFTPKSGNLPREFPESQNLVELQQISPEAQPAETAPRSLQSF